MKYLVILALVFFSTNIMAEESEAITAESEAVTVGEVAAPSDTGFSATIEMRPSYSYDVHKVDYHSENTLALDYDFSDTFSVGLTNYFNNNFYNSTDKTNGLGLIGQDSFIKANMSDLWTNESMGLSLSYQPRLYIPTDRGPREAGLVTLLRNNISLEKTFSDAFSLTLYEIPIFYFHSKDQHNGDANAEFENRVFLIGDITLGGGFSISVPVMWHQKLNRTVAGANKSGAWVHKIYVWPDVMYEVNDTISLGVSFRTGNFVAEDLSDTTFSTAFERGTYQMVLKASL